MTGEMREWALDDPQGLAVAGWFGVDIGSLVLDVGCDSGGFLEALGDRFDPLALNGIDVNAEAVEAGNRASSSAVFLTVHDAAASRFATAAYSHVFCMNALTYMHQARAVENMAAAVELGGFLILSYETARYDLMLIRSGKARAVRDLAYGALVHLTGRQPRASALWGKRAFVSTRKLRLRLEELGFTVELAAERSKGRRFLGQPTQRLLVARRLA